MNGEIRLRVAPLLLPETRTIGETADALAAVAVELECDADELSEDERSTLRTARLLAHNAAAILYALLERQAMAPELARLRAVCACGCELGDPCVENLDQVEGVACEGCGACIGFRPRTEPPDALTSTDRAPALPAFADPEPEAV